MIFKNKDGELRLYDASGATGPYYMTILFTNADLSYPLGRGRQEELLNMDRGNLDSNSSYSQGSDDVLFEPMPFTVSARLDDTVNARYLADLLSGVTIINSKTITTTKGSSAVTVSAGVTVTTPSFSDSWKRTLDAEIIYDGSQDLGHKIREVYFNPMEQTIQESADNITVNLNGMIYGAISRIASFDSGTTIQQ